MQNAVDVAVLGCALATGPATGGNPVHRGFFVALQDGKRVRLNAESEVRAIAAP